MVFLLDVLYPAYPWVDQATLLPVLIVINFAWNLALASILLKLVRFKFAKRKWELVKLIAGVTAVVFVAEALLSVLSFLSYIISFFMLTGVYYWAFKRLGVKGKRALAYGIIFGIFTNPLINDLALYAF